MSRYDIMMNVTVVVLGLLVAGCFYFCQDTCAKRGGVSVQGQCMKKELFIED